MSIKVFLESHNIKNLVGGFGVFNYSLLKEFYKTNTADFQFFVNLKRKDGIVEEFGNKFQYKKYRELHRFSLFSPKQKYDVWHCMNQNIKVEPFFKQKKYILTVHDVNFAEFTDSKNLRMQKNFKEKLKQADLITYISGFAKEHTHRYFDIPNIEEKIIYNGNPITTFCDTDSYIPNIPTDIPYFYSIGDFLEKKNFISIVRMMREISGFNLIISGNNNKKYGFFIQEQIKQLGLENRVFLTGKVTEQGKQYFMKNCVAFLFPSLAEGFGLPPIEAMKFGKPVFLANRASLPEVGADAAFYWDDFEPDYMRDVLENGLSQYNNHKELWLEKLIERANYFSWEKTAQEYFSCYRA